MLIVAYGPVMLYNTVAEELPILSAYNYRANLMAAALAAVVEKRLRPINRKQQRSIGSYKASSGCPKMAGMPNTKT